MKCFFGHKFWKVEADGFQYCQTCGFARKPSIPKPPTPPKPCAGGHTWKDDETKMYVETHYNPYGQKRENYSRQTFQTCKVCGDKREIWS